MKPIIRDLYKHQVLIQKDNTLYPYYYARLDALDFIGVDALTVFPSGKLLEPIIPQSLITHPKAGIVHTYKP